MCVCVYVGGEGGPGKNSNYLLDKNVLSDHFRGGLENSGMGVTVTVVQRLKKNGENVRENHLKLWKKFKNS